MSVKIIDNFQITWYCFQIDDLFLYSVSKPALSIIKSFHTSQTGQMGY